MTTTAGAASELLPQEQIIETAAARIERWIAGVAVDGSLAGMAAHKARSAIREAVETMAARATTPAPVTEGAQREAVAWRYKIGNQMFLTNTDPHTFSAPPGMPVYEIEPLYTAPPPPDRVQQREQETIDALAASQDAAATFSDSYAALVKRIWNLAKEWRMEAAAMRSPDGKTILVQCAEELDNARANSPDRVQPERVEIGPSDTIERLTANIMTDCGLSDFGNDRLFQTIQARLYEYTRNHMSAPPPPDRVHPERDIDYVGLGPNVPAPLQPERVEADSFTHKRNAICERELGIPFEDPAPPNDASSHSTNSSVIDSSLVVSPTDARGGVTREMVDAAIREIAKRPIPLQWPEDVQAVLESADRARKPGYRQVTMEDASNLIRRIGYRGCSGSESVLRGLEHIGAVIPDAGK